MGSAYNVIMSVSQYKGLRAVIYARISRDKEGEALGVQRQIDTSLAYVEKHEMDLVDTLVDNDRSAYSKSARPEFERLKRMIEKREIDAVVYWKQDRLARRNIEFWELVRIASPTTAGDRGVGFHATGDGTQGYVDLTTPNGLLAAGFNALMAEQEVAVRSDRIRNWHRQKAKANESAGGARPFGWDVVDKKFVVNEREAKALHQAAQDLLAGKSLGSIIREWNDPSREGGPLLSTLGNEITYATLKQMLLRTRNYGVTVTTITDTHEEIVTENPPIMSKDLFDRVERFLSNPARRKSKSNKAKHLLSNIVQCHCGAPMRSAHSYGREMANGERKYNAYYRCVVKGPGHVTKHMQYVDTVVELFVYRALVKDRIAHGDRPEVTEQVDELRQILEDLDQRKKDASRMFGVREIDADDLKIIYETLEEEKSETLVKLEALEVPSYDDDSGDMAQILRDYKKNDSLFREWRRMHIDDRREWIRRRFHIVLRPHFKGSSRTFDTDTVSVYERGVGEYGQTLSAEQVAELPLTPISDGGMPPSYLNLYSQDEDSDVQVTET